MYSEKLEQLIEYALADGVLTEKKRQALMKAANAEGIDPDEFEMVLEARLYKKQKSGKVVLENVEDALQNVWKSAKNIKVFDNFGNKITGRQAYLDRKEARKIQTDSEARYREYSEKTTGIQQDLNRSIEEYGRRKLETLKRTLGVFLSYLQRMEQRYKENYYELMDGCDFPKTYVAELGQLNMDSSELAKTPLFGDDMNLSGESEAIITKTRKILNTEL
jgi:hypothetical protein